jgi:hypothetical protein
VIKNEGTIDTHINMGDTKYNKELGNFLKNTVGSMNNLKDFQKSKTQKTEQRPKYENQSYKF